MSEPQVIAFVSIEDEAPDLIVSFALAPHASQSITLLRTPRYEGIFPEEERGVAVMSGDREYPRELLQSIAITPEEVVIQSQARTRRLSASRLSADDLAEAVAMLERMNFDNRFVINVA